MPIFIFQGEGPWTRKKSLIYNKALNYLLMPYNKLKTFKNFNANNILRLNQHVVEEHIVQHLKECESVGRQAKFS